MGVETNASGEDVYLGRDEVPNEANPQRGFIFSWNNKPAPVGLPRTASGATARSTAPRCSRTRSAPQKPHSITPVRLVQMMEQAGLTDLRGRYVAPLALELLADAQPGPREQAMIALLEEWIAEGALRRDGDGNGDYDRSAAVAIMDALVGAADPRGIFDPVLGDSAASRSPSTTRRARAAVRTKAASTRTSIPTSRWSSAAR